MSYAKDIIDVYLLRKARSHGVRLPTGNPPDEYKFMGAKVFESCAGTSENVVYIDVGSMYPSLIMSLNISPETLIGDKHALRESEYSESDCVWGYYDKRPVKHLDDDETYSHYTDGSYKMVYDPDSNSKKWSCDDGDGVEYSKLYFLDHQTERGFLTECVSELIALKNQYRGTPLYGSTKQVTNSIFGVLGWASENSSFRLFDWRLAEAITLTGRQMIMFSAEYVCDRLANRGYPEAHVALGDSVPADETVVVKDTDGTIDVRRIESLHDEVGHCERNTGYHVWTERGFTPIHTVIQKPNRKTMYRVRTKNGIVHVTEDHSLVLADGSEVSPEDVTEGDELLHHSVGQTFPDVSTHNYEISDELAWVLGLFVADGSCGVYESVTGTKRPWAINKSDRQLLEKARDIIKSEFDVNADIRDYHESSGCYKLKVNEFADGERIEFINWWREKCYTGDQKQVPNEILNGSEQSRTAFLRGYHDGDGFVREGSVYDEIDSMQFRDKVLAQGIAMLVSESGYDVTIDCRDNHDDEYYRIRTVSFHHGSPTEICSIEQYEYNGTYVYDLATENHHFQAGIGDIIVHNTDGCGIALPTADGQDDALSVVQDICDTLNTDGYDSFFSNECGVDPSDHHGEIEVESFAPKVFIPSRNPPHGDVGVKKRRIEYQTWDEGDDIDEISITGLEAERSDIAPLTRTAQELFAETFRMDDPKDELFTQLREWYDAVTEGTIALDRICKRGGIGQNLYEYGSTSRSPQPIYRGAKYATDHIDGVTVQQGDKPVVIYIDSIQSQSNEYPRTYEATTGEDGDIVDAVALNDVSRLPECFRVDWKRHRKKVLTEPLMPLLQTRFGEDVWEEITTGHTQTGFNQFAE
jgi:DNA polymerase elongation subunit (family B)